MIEKGEVQEPDKVKIGVVISESGEARVIITMVKCAHFFGEEVEVENVTFGLSVEMAETVIRLIPEAVDMVKEMEGINGDGDGE